MWRKQSCKISFGTSMDMSWEVQIEQLCRVVQMWPSAGMLMFTQGEWRLPKRCWKRRKIHCSDLLKPSGMWCFLAGLARSGWGHWWAPVFRCIFCVPYPWNGWWIDPTEGVMCPSKWGGRRNNSHCLKITCFRYTLQGTAGGTGKSERSVLYWKKII